MKKIIKNLNNYDLSKKVKKKVIIVFVTIILLLIFLTYVSISFYKTRIASYAFVKAKEVTQEKLTLAINEMLKENDTNNFLRDNKELDVSKLNKLRLNVMNILDENSTDTYQTVSIPYGIIISEVLFSGSNLTIDAKIRRTSSYIVDMVTTVTEYGINNSVLQIDLKVSFEILVLIPYENETVKIDMNIPAVILVLEGKVPNGIIYTQN